MSQMAMEINWQVLTSFLDFINHNFFLLDEGNYQDFKKLMEKNFVYVDKTDIIYKIVNLDTAFIINSERRTGKTLLLSTIKAIFEQKVEWWQQYGANLKIMKLNPNFFTQNPFPVIGFKFSQCQNNEDFIIKIAESLNKVIDNYDLQLDEIPININPTVLISGNFSKVLRHLQKKFQKKPIIITIDEADQPLINQMFSEKITNEKEKTELISSTIISFNQFYGFLKDQLAEGIVRLVVVAGHSMIAKSSIYSGITLLCLII